MGFPNGQTEELIVLLRFNQVFLDRSRKRQSIGKDTSVRTKIVLRKEVREIA